MSEPRFKSGDKAEFNIAGDGWIPVSIKSMALHWVSPHCGPGHLYLVQPQHDRGHLAHEDRLRPREQWKRCEGLHRSAGDSIAPMVEINKGHPGPWERLVS